MVKSVVQILLLSLGLPGTVLEPLAFLNKMQENHSWHTSTEQDLAVTLKKCPDTLEAQQESYPAKYL